MLELSMFGKFTDFLLFSFSGPFQSAIHYVAAPRTVDKCDHFRRASFWGRRNDFFLFRMIYRAQGMQLRQWEIENRNWNSGRKPDFELSDPIAKLKKRFVEKIEIKTLVVLENSKTIWKKIIFRGLRSGTGKPRSCAIFVVSLCVSGNLTIFLGMHLRWPRVAQKLRIYLECSQ